MQRGSRMARFPNHLRRCFLARRRFGATVEERAFIDNCG